MLTCHSILLLVATAVTEPTTRGSDVLLDTLLDELKARSDGEIADPHAFGFKDLADLAMPDTADEVDAFEALKTRTGADGKISWPQKQVMWARDTALKRLRAEEDRIKKETTAEEDRIEKVIAAKFSSSHLAAALRKGGELRKLGPPLIADGVTDIAGLRRVSEGLRDGRIEFEGLSKEGALLVLEALDAAEAHAKSQGMLGYAVSAAVVVVAIMYANRKRLPFPLATRKAGGLTCAGAKTAGYTWNQIRLTGYRLQEMKAAGFSCAEAKAADYALKEIKAVRYTCKEVRAANYTCKEVRAAEYTLGEIKTAGYTCEEARAAEYTLVEMKDVRYTCEDAKAANYTCKEVKARLTHSAHTTR